MLRVLTLASLVVGLIGVSEAQRYELIPADQARSMIAGEWENHPNDRAFFPDKGFSCEDSPIKFADTEFGLSVSTYLGTYETTVLPQSPSKLELDLSPIFGVSGSYSLFLANPALAFLTVPGEQPQVEDKSIYADEKSPEVTTRQRVVRLLRCKDPKKVS